MFRRYWLNQVLNSLQTSARQRRRGATFRPNVEGLEDRKLLSATMSVVDHGETLRITGDRGDNHIAITQDARGVHVVADDVAQTFTGIRNIEVNAGAGNDTITADIAFPPAPCRIAVNAGAGDDVVTLRTAIDPNIQSGELIPAVHGVDFSANLGAGNDTFNADLAYPPDPCRIAVDGGAGDDALNVRLGGDTQTVVSGDIDVMLNGGQGNDVVAVAMNHLTTLGSVDLDLNGGAGDDRLVSAFDKLFVKGSLNANVNGGQGNDDLSLIARSQPRTVIIDGGSEGTPLSPPVNPALITTGQVHIRLEGGGGSDQFHGDITPCVLPQTTAGSPQGLIDMVFVGGSGNDLFDINVTMENSVKGPELAGSVRVAVLGGQGDDSLTLHVNNLRESGDQLATLLVGGRGHNTADVTAGINTSGWRSGLSSNHNQTFLLDA